MDKKDLDSLNELYLSVYGGEQLNEKVGTALDAANELDRQGRGIAAAGLRAKAARVARGEDKPKVATDSGKGGQVTLNTAYPSILNNKPGVTRYLPIPGQPGRVGRYFTPNKQQAENPVRPAGSGSTPPPRPAGSGSTPPPRPAASSTVLAKQKGVEGKLDKATGKFTAGAFSGAEKSRYSSVATQNAARNSTSSAPKPPTPAIGKLGNTSFERRTPTSAELRAAQDARSKGASPEKALQAAQKTNLPTTGPTPAVPDVKSAAADLQKFTPRDMSKYPLKPATGINNTKPTKTPTLGTGATMQKQSYEWSSAKTLRDIAGAYQSVYEAKKKVDQDQDGDNDFADVRIARMVASGVPKAKAIAMVKDKSYNEEVELWVNELVEEGYDLSDYTWDEMSEIYLDEATRMRKELGKEGEIATRQELARRSNAYQRSGSVDRTIAAAERGAKNPYVVRGKNETEADYRKRKQNKTETLTRLASNRRGSVRDNPRAGLRGYAAKVEGSDRDLQSARSSAMAAGTLTPRERKQLNREAYEAYEFVASYLLENNFASRIEDANVIINNMSEGWFESIMEEKKPLPVAKMKRKETKLLGSDEEHLAALKTPMGSPQRKKAMRNLERFDNINTARTSISKRGGKETHAMPEVGRYKPKYED